MTWTFIVDTDQYSGNFERELTAHVTGLIGDCGVGEDIAQANENRSKELEDWCRNHANYTSEKGGYICYRPCHLENYEGGAYQSVAITFTENPPESILEELKQQALNYTSKTAAMKKALKAHNWQDVRRAFTIIRFRETTEESPLLDYYE